ncbi:eukaryotic translation initiation factor 4 gamma isoform X2 [Lucilia sericata]|uniref:eukaryotic translation initiation factor 4 gamma isoform X2 n=1 Tax=Lucilia sericata TaxID=13632 RepID=UPI0018A7FC67|nr:eukaryotic translation initiation factor 4 gamma isoform X2 [Lucilia sericata]
MFVNTGGGGKTQQQQQPLQNQTNASVRHNNPYPHTHTHSQPQQQQQQPHYEHHQGPVTFVTYPFCNVAPTAHGNTGGNGVSVGGGQASHVLYQTTHQPQSQPHPTQQQVGLHNAEQTLHYFTKSAQLPTHHLHHPSQQQHSQIRNMIAAVSHQRQPFVVSPNYFALSHALLPQQTRAPLLSNAAPQHAASGGSMSTQLQNTTPRSVAPSGPTAYVPPPYCTPPLLLGAPPTAVTPQPTPMLTAAAGIGQPPTLQAYAHMGGGMPTAPTSSTPINIPAVGLAVGGAASNTEHSTNIKQRKHAIPIINPDTLEIVTFEHLAADVQTQTQPQIPAKNEINVESVSIQTDNDNSLTASIASNASDVVTPTQSQSISVQTDDGNYDIVKQNSGLAIATQTVSVAVVNTGTQSSNSDSESPKKLIYDDPNDTDADTNEHELDNEDDVLDTIDGNLTCIVQKLPDNDSKNQQEPENVPAGDLLTMQPVESDSDHSTETEVKSKDEPCTISAQTSVDNKDEVKSKDIQQDLPQSVSSFVATEPKRGRKNKKAAKRKEKIQRRMKQQNNKSNSASVQNEDICTTSTLKTTDTEIKSMDLKNESEEETTNVLIRYSLEELKAFAKSPESRKTPVVPCQKGDCISQLFVARQQHHHHHLTHQVGQNLAAINLQHHVQQSYHHMNFNESIEFVSGKRRVGGGVGSGGIQRKHHDHHSNAASTGNINITGLSVAPGSSGVGGNSSQIQKKMQVIRINLSLNEEIKLSKCENAWQPKFLSRNSNNNSPTTEKSKNDDGDIDDVLKKVRGILNKLTSENFDVLLKEMTSITINTQEKMQKVMLLIFEKTVSEPNFAPTYAKFSKVLFEEFKADSKKIFNALLIKRLQTEFELNVNNADAKERKLQQIINKLNETTDQQEKLELQAELEHQEYQFRRRAWGTVRFIGEMYKLHSLTADRVLQCVESLLEHGNEEKLEYMCKLLTTVGNLLESNDADSFNNNLRMNKIFAKIQTIVKEAREPCNKKNKICSRVRFMMQDLIDLRSRNWGQSPNTHNSHVTLRRRHPDIRNSNLSSGSLNAYDRGSSQRSSFGNNNNRHNQTRNKDSAAGGNGGNYFIQKATKSQYSGQREQHSIDLKKLNFSRGDDSSQATTKLGNSSIYMWSTAGRQAYQSSDSQNSGRTTPTSLPLNTPHQYQQKHQQPHQSQYWGVKNQNSNSDIKAILTSSSNKDNQKLLNHLIEEYLDCLPSRSNRWHEEVFNTWQKTTNKQQICLVYYILMNYLHLAAVKRLERNACADIFVYLMTSNAFSKTTFTRAYEQFAEEFPDLLMDVPNGWTYVLEFLGPMLHERFLSFNDIWNTNWRNDQVFTERFIKALVVYFTKEFGANYVRDLWHNEFKLDRGQVFMGDQQQWRQFIALNKLQFLYDSKAKPEIITANANNNNNNDSSLSIEDHHVKRLEILLSSPNDSNLALDYINTNVNININFLKNLTRLLCDYATTMKTTLSGSSPVSKNSSTCSNTSSRSSTKNTEQSSSSNNARKPQLNVNIFRKNCLPLLRLCIDAHEDHELACLDSVVDDLQQEFDTNTANELICGIFDILYDCEVIPKESFEKWYNTRQHQQQDQKKHVVNSKQIKRPLSAHLEAYMQKLL